MIAAYSLHVPLQEAIKAIADASDPAAEQEARFNAAVLQTFSADRSVSLEGIEALNDLLQKGHRPPLVLFFLASGHMHRGDFIAARSVIHQLVRMEPGNERAAALIEIYKSRVKEQTVPGLIIAGVLGAVAIGGLFLVGRWLLNRGGN